MAATPILSLSTCWCSNRHEDGYVMLKEMAELGFEYVELSHGIRMTLVPGILKAVAEGVVKVSTTHNFCPLPAGIMVPAPNAYQPSSPNPGERELWRRYTGQSLEFAQRVGAKVMVLHCGSEFFFFFNPASKVNRLTTQAKDSATPLAENAEYTLALGKLLAKLRKAGPKHYGRVREGFTELAEKARVCGVKFGVENREGLLELPLDEDMESFLASVEALGVCGGWHDVGHARIKEKEGVLKHAEFLEKNHARLMGFHLHDVSAEGKDHQQPGTGSVDWAMVRKYVKPEHIVVVELSPKLRSEQVRESKAFIEKWLG
jgi:sugar phosphate isomerase/epimerase